MFVTSYRSIVVARPRTSIANQYCAMSMMSTIHALLPIRDYLASSIIMDDLIKLLRKTLSEANPGEGNPSLDGTYAAPIH
jgi:hypothetical protein